MSWIKLLALFGCVHRLSVDNLTFQWKQVGADSGREAGGGKKKKKKKVEAKDISPIKHRFIISSYR